MKILIVGSGGVGGFFGAMLHRGGHDVLFMARGEHLKSMLADGLQVESVVPGNFTVKNLTATQKPDGSWKADLALFCVKSYSNEEAIEAMRPAVGPQTLILTLQNGIGSGDALAAAFGEQAVLLGATYIDASRPEPGLVSVGRHVSLIVFGEADGSRTARAIQIYEELKKAELDIELSDNIHIDLWKKLIYICCLSGMWCLTRATTFSEILQNPPTRGLAFRVMQEAAATAAARDVPLDSSIAEDTLAYFDENSSDLTSSMLLDLKRGKPIEVGVLNGAVSRLGNAAGVPTPVNDFIYWCLSVHDKNARGFQQK